MGGCRRDPDLLPYSTRVDEGFAYLSLGGAHIMVEQRDIGRNWVTGALEAPFGRGINLQITVAQLDPILEALDAADHPLFMAPETTWYRIDDSVESGVRQFLVSDPDGCLVRFQMPLGHRPIGDPALGA